eukprot:SAG11_NODE_14366_length_614_cov_2.487379_1_plen_66_part_00
MCEECGSKLATYGLAAEKRRRWCAGCGKAHGAVDVASKMCEECGSKHAKCERYYLGQYLIYISTN